MARYILFPIGDWSSDGHACCAQFLVKSQQPLEQVRQAHLKENDFLGSLCHDYEDNQLEADLLHDFLQSYLSEGEIAKLFARWVHHDIDLVDENQADVALDADMVKFFLIDTPEKMLLVWLDLLNIINPTLSLEVASEAMSRHYIKHKGYPHEPEGSIEYSGYRNGVHLKTPGYGIWQDYDGGEFQNPC